MLSAYREGRSTINAFARIVGAEVTAVDVGVGNPTGDIRFEAALDVERFERRRVAPRSTPSTRSTATCSCSARWGSATPRRRRRSPRHWPAARPPRGSGAAPASTTRGSPASAAAVQESVRRIAGVTDPIEILREVGGAELVAIAAATIAARHRSIPVVLDGYVVTAAVLPLNVAEPTALDHCTVGHCSAEPGHRELLERLGKRPLLDLDMRLGEGSGRDGGRPADRDGVRRGDRGADVRRVVRRVTSGR